MATQVTIYDPVRAKSFSTPRWHIRQACGTGADVKEQRDVVDVRAADDYAEGHIPGAVNLPKDQWQSLKGLRRISRTCCTALPLSAISQRPGRCNSPQGYPVMELDGGWRWWKEEGFQIEK
jgi:rhodanese-related sulfurtransferase